MKLKHILSILALCASATIMADESYPSITTDQLPLNDTIVDWDNDGMVIMEDGKGFVALYNNNDGIAIECQNYPDGPNKADYPNCVLRPGEVFEQAIIYAFGTR